jgi:hypothetical protein
MEIKEAKKIGKLMTKVYRTNSDTKIDAMFEAFEKLDGHY